MAGSCNNSTNGSIVWDRYNNEEFRMEFFPVGFYLQRYWDPLVIILGLVGNTIAFRVWINPKLRRENSSAVYLAAISLTDFILLLFMIPHYLIQTRKMEIINKEVICQSYNMFFIIFQYYSIPLVFAFTLERYIAICYPFQRERFCTTRRACIAVAIIGGFVTALGTVQLFTWVYDPVKDVCEFREIYLRNKYISGYFACIELIMSALLPIFTLLLNILVLKELRRITRSAAKHAPRAPVIAHGEDIPLSGGDCGQSGKERNRESSSFRSTTMMLLAVSFYLIGSTLPVGILFICQFFVHDGEYCLNDDEIRADPVWRQFFTVQTIKECIDRFSISHYACNFIIYLTTGKAFRTQAIKLLSCGKCDSEDEYYRTGTARDSSFATNGKNTRHSRSQKTQLT